MSVQQPKTGRVRRRGWVPYSVVLGRAVHGASPRVVRAATLLARTHTGRSLEPFALHRRPGRNSVALLTGYRDLVKQRWRTAWWPLAAVYALRSRADLTPALAEIVTAVDGARTLPFPLEDVARAVCDVAHAYPDDLRVSDRIDTRLGVAEVEVIPRDADHAGTAASYRAAADGVARVLRQHGLRLERSRLLEIGPGIGAVAFALAEIGAAEIVGVDPEAERYAPTLDQQRMLAHLVGDGRGAVQLQEGDVHSLPFPDGSFDGIYSTATLEHVRDVAAAFHEMRRVLRPGGLAYHGIDAWFGPRGGHALCTLDFPWGHVRSSADELEEYVRIWRPHEADDAVVFRRHAVQDPPLTARDLRAAARAAGFQVVALGAVALPVADPHWRYLDSQVLHECRRLYPGVTRGDLVSLGQTLVLRRR